MAQLLKKSISIMFAILLVLATLQQTEAKIKLKKLVKAGLVLGFLGSRALPRVLPIPVPIPIRNREKSFGGGHYGQDYYSSLGGGFAPAFGSGGYHLGSGGFGNGVYGGGGYTAEAGWW